MADFIKYDLSIVKLDKDGNKVLSDTLYPGEKIAHTGQTFASAKTELAARIKTETTSGYTALKEDADEPAEGSPTSTLDPSMTSTVRGTYHAAK